MGLTVGLGPASASGGGGGGGVQNLFKLDFVSTTATAQVTDTSISEFPLVDTSMVTDMTKMFYSCSQLKSIPSLNTSKATKMSNMFYGCSNLESIPVLDTSNVTTMDNMFFNCSNLESIPMLDTSNVTTMDSTFRGCTKLKTIPLSDTSKVLNMSSTFNGTSIEEFSGFDTSSVTRMSGTFANCVLLKKVIMDVSSCSSLSPFSSCYVLETALLKGLKTSLTMTNSAVSKESVLYIFEHAQDVSVALTIRLHSDVFNQLTADEIAIATQKGFSVVSS